MSKKIQEPKEDQTEDCLSILDLIRTAEHFSKECIK